MTETHHTDRGISETAEDCVTIIAASAREVMQAALDRGLGEKGYIIAGRVLPHRFAMAGEDGAGDMFGSAPMVAATWVRRQPTN